MNKWSSLQHLFKARLSHRVAFWVFISIVIIEIIILLPSVQRRETELLQQLERVGKASLAPMVILSQNQQDFDTIFKASHQFVEDFPVLGGALYHHDGTLLSHFGTQPSLQFKQVIAQLTPSTSYRYQDRDYYEVAWLLVPHNEQETLFYRYLLEKLHQCRPSDSCPQMQQMTFILRFDARPIQAEIWAFIARIAGLVLVICLFVTTGTLFVLGPLVINPILRLQRAVTCFGEHHQKSEQNLQILTIHRNDELGEVMQAFNRMTMQISQQINEIKSREQQLKTVVNELEQANQQAERLLLNILPVPIAEQLKAGVSPIANYHPHATVLFADIVGFTPLASHISPTQMVNLLNRLFTLFDHLAEQHQLEKIKTIGDAYMVVGGLPIERPDHAEAVANMALAMLTDIESLAQVNAHPLQIRIGIHTGPVVAGVIGVKKFIYDLWGDTVNIASRMESHGKAGAIQVSEATYQQLKDRYQLQPRGWIEIKGRGEMMTYWLIKQGQTEI